MLRQDTSLGQCEYRMELNSLNKNMTLRHSVEWGTRKNPPVTLGNDKERRVSPQSQGYRGKSNLWKLVTLNLALYTFRVQIYNTVFLEPMPKKLAHKAVLG